MPTNTLSRLLLAGLAGLGLSACGDKVDPDVAKYNLPEVVDYNFHIKPILSDSCFLCHGPDTANAKAGLSLNTFEKATTHKLDSGNFAIVPGDADASEALQRILTDDPGIMMPPSNSNLRLSDRDKALIKRWINQGAEYKKHWSFISPETPNLPEVAQQDWPVNPIDNFILHKIESKKVEDKQLKPNAEADKETLIRRVTFDITGLPPTLEEIDSFLADNSADAYEKLVDRLLAKPAYGERMASEWLDVARYADTHGYATDPYRDVSPYRDWVIKAFNENKPFDEFITWQLAGDLLPTPSDEQLLATAFNRMHTQNNEGGIVNEEFRVEYVKDRVQAVGTGLLGLTMHCAQCHDHKYDDIPAKHYYQTFAMFNNIDESGQISWDAGDMPVPTMLLPNDEQKAKVTKLKQQVENQESALEVVASKSQSGFTNWLKNKAKADLFANDVLIAHYPFSQKDSTKTIHNALDKKQTGKVLFSSSKYQKDGPALVVKTDQGNEAIEVNGDDALFFPSMDHFNRATPFTVAIKAKFPADLTDGVLFHFNKSSILYNYKGFDVTVEDNHWVVRLAHTYPYNAIALRSQQPVTTDVWQHVALTYNGSSKADGVTLYVDGQPVAMNVERDNLYKDIRHRPKDELGLVVTLKVGARWRSRGAALTLVDDLKVWSTDLTQVEILANANQALGKDFSVGDVASESQWLAYYNQRVNKQYVQALDKLTDVRNQYNAANEDIPEIMIMQELAEQRPTYILERGLYNNYGEQVEAGVPEAVFPFDPNLPKNRIGLAKWLTDPQHPLLARVVSNRYWMMLMGTGIVRTPEDFGSQGQLPTHPDALDWLSREFIDSGWDIKHIVKTIAMSATYRQSSIASELKLEADPENTLYARGPSNRLTAEMLRDNVLAASGLLVEKLGGKSVYPYQPEGLWVMNRGKYQQSTGDDLYRRSLYTIWKRNAPPPSMHNFDTPTRSYSVGTRQSTNTPLQALTLMNDPQYVEAGRILAERVMTETQDGDQRLVNLYRRLTSKFPDEHELSLMQDMYKTFADKFQKAPEQADELLTVGEKPSSKQLDKHSLAALSTVANLVMNHDATVIKR
ncbi:hypothetical protein C2869_04640 [Saccharobesus litoralis]|uniref:Planctomycete cytochrome C n=1 Tax=Saccharobesus litoralis TaxID=2172099 RepID=A0A2S0VNJ2_9ALTE|nr:DUF1553 domain-containing protein [Saccharobesus litoralis]AWB65766.1 hypothetical protein C2869_04640 [Saccharobesus litoralis]